MKRPDGIIWLDGQLTPAAEAQIPALDRGLLYGDGVFETIRLYGATAFRLSDHLERLFSGAEALQIPVPYSREELTEALNETARQSELREAYVRITVTRGVGGLPSDLRAAKRPTVMIHVRPFDGYPSGLYERGMRAQVSAVRRNETSPLSRVKSLNYLDSLLARARAASEGFDEAIMLNTRDMVTEGTASNLFAVRGGELLTPPIADGCLPGITRAVVMELAGASERSLCPEDVLGADEAFLTNSLMEVMPLVHVHPRSIGRGAPGPVTERMRTEYRELVLGECGTEAA